MKILMLKDLKKVGKKGEVIEVSDGYGANFIIPQGYGRMYDEKAKKDFAAEQKAEVLLQEELKQKAEEEKGKLQGLVLNFEAAWGRNGYMIGQISPKQVESALKAKGFVIDKKKFVKKEPITSFGSSKVEIELYKGVIATVSVMVKEKVKE